MAALRMNPRLRRSTRVAWLLLLAAALTPASRAADRIPLCVGDFPPYNASQLPEQGPVIQLITEAFRRQRHTVQVEFMPWARIIKLGEQGQCAVVGMWRNEQRDRLFSYSRPLLRQELGFFARKPADANAGPDLRRLQDLTLGVERGSYLSPILREPGLRLDLAAGLSSNLRKLAAGRVDLAYGDRAAGEYLLSTDPALSRLIEWKPPRLEFKDTYLAVAKQSPQGAAWLAAFEKGLTSMQADGSYQALLKQAGLSPAE